MSPKQMLRTVIWVNAVVIVFAIALGLNRTTNPSRFFGEGRFTLILSCAQLLLTAFFSARIFGERRAAVGTRDYLQLIWVFIALGFVFLASDDAFQLHEKTARLIRVTFQLPKNDLTKHIDDALIAVYGLAGIVALWISRRELLAFRRELFPPLIAGFVAMLISVVCDAMSHDEHYLQSMTGELGRAKWLQGWVSTGDGAFTLIAEGLFLAGFYAAWHKARTPKTVDVTRVNAESGGSP